MVASRALEFGRSASAAHRWREAFERFAEARTAAVEIPGPDLELLSTAAFLRGRLREAFDALTAAHEHYLSVDDTLGAARTAGWLAIELLEAGEVSQSAAWVARGLRLVERLEDPTPVGGLVALVPAAFTTMFVGDVRAASARYDEIAAMAERSGDVELAAYASFGRGKNLTMIGKTIEGMASLDVAMSAVAAGQVSPVTACVIYRVALDAWHEAFDLSRAERWTAAFAEWCDGQPELVSYSGQSLAYRAQLLLLRGNWAGASAAAHLAEERLRAGDFTAAYVANYQLAELHRLRGEARAAEEHFQRAADAGWDPQPGLALLRLAGGQPHVAQTMIRSSVVGAVEATRRRLLPALVHIEIAAGDVAAGRKAADELWAFAASASTPMLDALAAFAEAEVRAEEGDSPAALEAADAALRAWSSVDAPYEAARCRLLKAQVLHVLGETEAVTRELDAARATFAELGARSALGEVNALSGERPPSMLTARELEVLRLVSTGLTNRRIAERLSLSEKTVARHLSNIFGKLGLSSRAAATAYAYDHALL
jgi:DNA-binding CsgD family transcriptional regulator